MEGGSARLTDILLDLAEIFSTENLFARVVPGRKFLTTPRSPLEESELPVHAVFCEPTVKTEFFGLKK